MRFRWFRLLPLLFAAFWLPVQAIAATAMPFCRHGEAHGQTHATAAMAGMAQGMEHCPLHDTPAPDDHGMNCDDCGFCHLAGAGFMPATRHDPAALPASRDFQSRPEQVPASAITEPPQYPPKRAT
jgi:hypothetical protein